MGKNPEKKPRAPKILLEQSKEDYIGKEATMSKKHKKRRWAKSHLLKIYVFCGYPFRHLQGYSILYSFR